MGFDIKLPQINAATEKEQLSQIRRYLYGLAEQLNFALNAVDKGTTENVNVINTTTNAPLTEEAAAQSNFNSIKSLIIKSADIVNAYYDVINEKLVGEYSALSEFGEYTEKTEKFITETSQFTNEYYASEQVIKSTLDAIGEIVLRNEGYIKTGELYKDKDGNSVYGVEVGQTIPKNDAKVYRKYARFMAGRLSFYDQNDVEVAHISGYKLYITHAEIKESLTIGGFVIDATKGFTLKWVKRT